MFHYTQRIWKMVQKCNLVNGCANNVVFQSFVRHNMALPFLPPDTIQPVFVEITVLGLNLTDNQLVNFAKLKRFIQRRWINQVSNEELSIWNDGNSTNIGAESYHGRLKSIMKCNHPRIWNFLEILNEIIPDIDNELSKLNNGLPITRPKEKTGLPKEKYRRKCKEKLIESIFSPLEFLKEISKTVVSIEELSTFDRSFDKKMIPFRLTLVLQKIQILIKKIKM